MSARTGGARVMSVSTRPCARSAAPGPAGAACPPTRSPGCCAAPANGPGCPTRVTGHSLRAGFATAALLDGWSLPAIAKHGRWAANSTELWAYFREAKRWERPGGDGFNIPPTEEDLARG
jgi:hypothetical protein